MALRWGLAGRDGVRNGSENLKQELANYIGSLPSDPARVSTQKLAEACALIYARRDDIVGVASLDAAREALRRVQAIEKYVAARAHKDEARRAARILEAAVGEALGPADDAATRGAKGGRGKKAINRDEQLLKPVECSYFRLMAEHRSEWIPRLETTALSRKQVLDLITVSRKPPPGKGMSTEDIAALPAEHFGTIYADPPWKYNNQGTRAATGNHYSAQPGENSSAGMTIEQICALPIARLALPNAHLHLWTTNGFLFDAKRVMEAWGFTYKSCFVWVKPQMGIGNYWRLSHEFLLLGVRGSAPFADKSLMSWGQFPRAKHSDKPEQVREFIERASPGPYLELFARRRVPRWTCWGNEIRREIFAA